MGAPSWTDYVGAVAGVVGMVTGISGAVMGYLGYRRSNQIKALDLRMALQKDLGAARACVTTVRELMASAHGSQRATLAARGLSQSSAIDAWEKRLEVDRAEVATLAAAIPREGTDFAALSEAQLEAALINAHKIKIGLSTLIERYRGEIAADDEARRQIAQQATAMAAARMSQHAAKPPR